MSEVELLTGKTRSRWDFLILEGCGKKENKALADVGILAVSGVLVLISFLIFTSMTSKEECRGKSFKEVFKLYKRKKWDLTHSNDFRDGTWISPAQQENVVSKKLMNDSNMDWESVFGMDDPRKWELYTFKFKPGLICIKNPFKPYGQRYWIARCLRDFTKRPNHLNIDAHHLLEEDEDWWEFCHREHCTDRGRHILKKLRWATLGYHHNWDSKQYSEELKGDFPSDLRLLCREIGNALGFFEFNAQAAIINMYHSDSCLNGHTDHSEINLDAPLFSFSFGQSAVFLIGGKTIDEEPTPLLLESGDIVIMSEEARLCYHGVPKILNCKNKTWSICTGERDKKFMKNILDRDLLINVSDENYWQPFDSYVSSSRINMNVRQVLYSGQTELS